MGVVFRRREFLFGSAVATRLAGAQENPFEDSATASATEGASPIVSIVPSSFDGAEDHDGTIIPGLTDPQPTDADLTDKQLEAVLRKAIDIASPFSTGFNTLLTSEDWVVIKIDTGGCSGGRGSATDQRIVRSLLSHLAGNCYGKRFSVADRVVSCPVYREMIADLGRRYPKLEFELVDLGSEETSTEPVPQGASASNNPDGVYQIPKTILHCDKLISVAPMRTDTRFGVSAGIVNYLGIAQDLDKLFSLGEPEEVLLDLFDYHPADFAIVGGEWGLQGDGEPIHHALILAGANAVAVDAAAAAVMGFDAADLPYLDMAELNGHGIWDTYSIWVRGREIEDATYAFAKPSGW